MTSLELTISGLQVLKAFISRAIRAVIEVAS